MIAGIIVMAMVTYLVRVLPMVIFRKKITNVRIRSFLPYVPYAVLSAMTFPAIFTSTGSVISATVGCAVAIFLAFNGFYFKNICNKKDCVQNSVFTLKTPLFVHCAISPIVFHIVKNYCLTLIIGRCTIKLQRGSDKLPNKTGR